MANNMETKKYSVDTNPGYKGMVGCLDYMMRTCNSLDDENVVKLRRERENKLIYAYNNKDYPEVKDMIECAFQEEMGRATASLKELTKKGEHIRIKKCKMCIDELNRLRIVIGIK